MADARMVRIAEIEVDPAHLDAYNALLSEEIAASGPREPGVLVLHTLHHVIAAPGKCIGRAGRTDQDFQTPSAA